MIPISVVMPTYNTFAGYLREAVESILTQTFDDFECIIVDDCSSLDESVQYLKSITDPRVKIIWNRENLGITKSLNIGLRAAAGKYIARMDSDDVSLSCRFKKQFDFMESHPDVIACGSGVELFGDSFGRFNSKIKNMDEYRIRLLFENPGPCHPTVFFNRELLIRHNLNYDENLIYAQDYGLWVEISRLGKVSALDDVLLRKRMHFDQITGEHRKRQIQCEKMTQERLLSELLGNVTKEEIDFHHRYSSNKNQNTKISMETKIWYQRLLKANNKVQIYNKRKLRAYIYNDIIKRLIYQSIEPGMGLAERVSLFFHYLPASIAIKSSVKMFGRMVAGRALKNLKIKMRKENAGL